MSDRERLEEAEEAGAVEDVVDDDEEFEDSDEEDENGDGAGFNPFDMSGRTLVRIALGALVVLGVIAGIAIALSSDDTDQSIDDSDRGEVSAIGTAGCESFPDGVDAGTTFVRVIESDGVKRTYRVHVPAGMDADERLALVFNFHGVNSTAETQEEQSGLVPVSDEEGFLLVSPQGEGSPASWTAISQASPADDLVFFDDMLAALKSELCVEEGAVYATGFSMGGAFAARLACLRSAEIAGAAAVAGIYYPNEECGSEAVPMQAIHGTDDEVVPYQGGQVEQFIYIGVGPSITEWGERNGCDLADVTAEELNNAQRQFFGGCEAATELISVAGLKHAWPEEIGDEPTGEVIWGFLSAGE